MMLLHSRVFGNLFAVLRHDDSSEVCLCVCVQVLRQLDECLQEAGINRANVTEVRTGAYTMSMMPFSMLFHQQCPNSP